MIVKRILVITTEFVKMASTHSPVIVLMDLLETLVPLVCYIMSNNQHKIQSDSHNHIL